MIPPDLGPAEIEARLGAVFITPAEVQQFLRETLADASVTVTLGADGDMVGDGRGPAQRGGHPHLGHQGPGRAVPCRASPQPEGTGRGHPQGRRGETWTDEEATAAAREKQAELSDRFAGWVWEDLDRASEICRRYNDAFNAIVLRTYDDVQLSLPGVNRDIDLFWWQKAAIARMIYEPTAGLFHDMGAGKTLEQIIGVMEQKRLGLIRKPVICVKNHLLDQFRDEFLWAYPQARILCAGTEDLEGEGRRQFIARCAAENPDAIIMTRGAFESIPLTPEGHEAYLDYMKHMFAVHAEAVTEHGQGRGDAAGRVRAAAARLLRSRMPSRTKTRRRRASRAASGASARSSRTPRCAGSRWVPTTSAWMNRRTSTTCGFPPTSRAWRSTSSTGPSTWK